MTDRSTEWALLFPLKAGLFAMRSTMMIPKKDKSLKYRRVRRGSSLSDLDKIATTKCPPLPDVVRSTEMCCAAGDSLPQSPALSRTNLQLSNSQVRGSIGDLMNMKKFGGSNWSVRSESLIARAVPLSTVTPKQSPPLERSLEDLDLQLDFGEPLTCAQRTQRLSWLIRRQRSKDKSKKSERFVSYVYVQVGMYVHNIPFIIIQSVTFIAVL